MQIIPDIFYLIFRMLGIYTEVEIKTNIGRIDAVIEYEALQQIKQTQHYQKYRLCDKPITLIGANFDSKQRAVSQWKHEVDSY